MRKIIVFTKKSSLNAAFDDYADTRADIKVLDGITATIILFDENENVFEPVTDFTREGLYFIYDLIPEVDFIYLIKNFNKGEFYILKHSKPEFQFTGFTNIVNGITEIKARHGLHYPTLLEILLDEKMEKVERIFKSIFIFDSEEEFLTEEIFNSIYNNKGKDITKETLRNRDKYLSKKYKDSI